MSKKDDERIEETYSVVSEELVNFIDRFKDICSPSLMVYILSRTAASITLSCAKNHEEGIGVIRDAISAEYDSYNEKKGK